MGKFCFHHVSPAAIKEIRSYKAKQMISFNAYFTIQLAKPKSVLIYIYSVLNQIGPVDGSNCCINKT